MRSLTFASLFASVALAQKTQVSTTVYDQLSRYARFASASYSSNCANPPFGSSVEKEFEDKKTDTQVTLFRDDNAQEYILSFRGTSNVQDFLTDLDQTLVSCSAADGISCLGCTCAQGYLGQYVSVQDDIVTTLTSSLASSPSYQLVVTGHSMGGALASLAAASLQGQNFTLTAYTYGQPRTGDQAYADYVDTVFTGASTMIRATHSNDGVPQIPAQSDGYRHHTTEYWESDDSSSAEGTYQCTGQEPQDCNQSEKGYGIGNGGVGINLAHLTYFGISIGNPLNPNAAC
ncbi:putative feruloyl esterase a [Diaporthe ampelina]|uniref:Putative feruloyl esterase a n=1 Tax=Diaporthe ampelina TaxID=1214573 RepID=A0A0G2F638_9PEZI|nr:putative feruloyl esterase a [Diaporthe ampelina]